MPERKKSPSGLKNRPGSGEEKDIQEVLHDRRQNGVVKRMCAEDQLYLDLEQEFQRKSAELQVEYTKKQQKHLDARKAILKEDGKDVPSFWLEAMKNVPHLADDIAEHDEPLLACVTDIRVDNLPDPAAMQQTGFFVEFEFSEKIDEWLDFSKTEEFKKDGKRVLKRTFHTKVESPYVGELSVEKIELNSCGGDGSLEGMWKAGKNITVEKKKVKAGKKKKGKATHVEKEVPRESFFRRFFRTIDPENQQVEDLQVGFFPFPARRLGTLQ